MDSEKKETLYQLKNPFEYAFKGEQRNADFISLKAPSMKQHHQAAELQQSIMTMVREEYTDNDNPKDVDDSDKDGDITAELILTLMYCSKKVEVNIIFEQAKALFKTGVALIDGEQNFTAPLVDKMSIVDFENLTGEYIVNFILA